MRTSTQYREFAEECLRLAKVARTEPQRYVLHEVAETWKKLAEEADQRNSKSPNESV
jgi:hypothetical protein